MPAIDNTCRVIHDKDPGMDCIRITMIDPAGPIDLLYRADVLKRVIAFNGNRLTCTLKVQEVTNIAEQVFRNPSGHHRVDGGPVPRRNMRTTIVTMVWATDNNGMKHVRIEVASKTALLWGNLDTIVPNITARVQYQGLGLLHLAVYPQLYSTVAAGWSPYYHHDDFRRHERASKFIRLIEKNLTDAVNWLVLADWLDEQGDSPFPDYTRQVREFFK